MSTYYHLHVAGVGMLQKWEVDYQHGTEPTHRLPESASTGCRLPILRSVPLGRRFGRTNEPTDARRPGRSSSENDAHQLQFPSTTGHGSSAPSGSQRTWRQSHQVPVSHLPIAPEIEFRRNCCRSSRSSRSQLRSSLDHSSTEPRTQCIQANHSDLAGKSKLPAVTKIKQLKATHRWTHRQGRCSMGPAVQAGQRESRKNIAQCQNNSRKKSSPPPSSALNNKDTESTLRSLNSGPCCPVAPTNSMALSSAI